MPAIVLPNTGGIAMTNAFVVADSESKQCVLFDAPDHTVEPLLDEIESRGWTLVGLWLTHGHFDHLADHKVVTDRFANLEVRLHPLDEPLLTNPTPQARMFGVPFHIPPGNATASLHEGDVLHVGSLEARVMHTPGHCPGHCAFYFETAKLLVGGDLIIGGSVGRTDLPGADQHAFIKSLRRVMELPDDVTLLPGHGDITTIGDERIGNEYLRSLLG